MCPFRPYSLMTLKKVSSKQRIYWCKFDFYSSQLGDRDDFVLAQHGWFTELNLCPLQKLVESCMQLKEVDPLRTAHLLVPTEGITHTLRGSVLRLDLSLKVGKLLSWLYAFETVIEMILRSVVQLKNDNAPKISGKRSFSCSYRLWVDPWWLSYRKKIYGLNKSSIIWGIRYNVPEMIQKFQW